MTIRFNADEIFEIALQIESNGAKFYRTAAKMSAFAGAKKVLLDLASKEDEHHATFMHMRKQYAADKKRAEMTMPDPDDTAARYLQAMADGEVFARNADPSSTLTGRETARDILRIALGLEKDSIIFYFGLIDMIPEDSEKGRIQKILHEEQEHIVVLNRELASLPA